MWKYSRKIADRHNDAGFIQFNLLAVCILAASNFMCYIREDGAKWTTYVANGKCKCM